MCDEPGIQRFLTAVESFQRVDVSESRGLEHCSAPCKDRWFACGCRQPRRVGRSLPNEFRRLFMDKVGGKLDAVQGRLLRAKLDALRLDCHSDTSFFPSVISARNGSTPSLYGECTYRT